MEVYYIILSFIISIYWNKFLFNGRNIKHRCAILLRNFFVSGIASEVKKGDKKKKATRLRRGVDDLGMPRVNWKCMKRMNLIVLASEESRRDTGTIEKKP